MAKKKSSGVLRKIALFVGKIVLYFVLISMISTLIFRFIPIPITPLMVQRLVEQKMNGKDFKLKKDWKSLDEISPKLQLAVMASEDQKFDEHFGFDIEAIQKATKFNERHTKRKRGASTISQQTAKNVFLLPTRSWIRKGFEVYFTFLIEALWSKKRIMEVYLNVIEMGDGIYGAEAASQAYFHKPAKKMSASQSALIAAIIPSPLRYSATHPSGYVLKRQSWILNQMNNFGGKPY